MIRIRPEELKDVSGGITIGNAFGVGAFDAAFFDWGAVADAAYMVVNLPASWQGENIDVIMGCFHKKSGLTGGVDDGVRLEFGYETLADTIRRVDLGTQNDGTAPHEVTQVAALGIILEAVKWVSLTNGANIAVGASDNWMQLRITRDANEAADTLAATMFCMGLAIIKV